MITLYFQVPVQVRTVHAEVPSRFQSLQPGWFGPCPGEPPSKLNSVTGKFGTARRGLHGLRFWFTGATCSMYREKEKPTIIQKHLSRPAMPEFKSPNSRSVKLVHGKLVHGSHVGHLTGPFTCQVNGRPMGKFEPPKTDSHKGNPFYPVVLLPGLTGVIVNRMQKP